MKLTTKARLKGSAALKKPGFWIGLAYTIVSALQASFSTLSAVIEAKTFAIAGVFLGVSAMTLKFLEGKVAEEPEELARNHDGTDEGGQ